MFRTERLAYSHLTPEDAEFTFGLRNGDYEYSKSFLVSPYPTSLERERAWIAGLYGDRSRAYFAMRLLDGGAPVGYCALQDVDPLHRRCAAGVIVAADQQGRGYGREAVGFLCRYAGNDLGLAKVSATVLTANGASLRIFKDNGYEIEGTLRRHFYISGRWEDAYLLARLL